MLSGPATGLVPSILGGGPSHVVADGSGADTVGGSFWVTGTAAASIRGGGEFFGGAVGTGGVGFAWGTGTAAAPGGGALIGGPASGQGPTIGGGGALTVAGVADG